MQTDMCFRHIAELREHSSLLKICNKTEHTYWCYKQEILPVMDKPRKSLLKHLKQVKLYRTIRDLFYCLNRSLMHEVTCPSIVWLFICFDRTHHMVILFFLIHYHSLPFITIPTVIHWLRESVIQTVSQTAFQLIISSVGQSVHQTVV